MKFKKTIPFIVAAISFLALIILNHYLVKIVFNLLSDEIPRLVLFSTRFNLYPEGSLILSIVFGWLIAIKQNPNKIKNYARIFKRKLRLDVSLIFSLILIVSSFANINIFTNNYIYMIRPFSINPVNKIKYDDCRYFDIKALFVKEGTGSRGLNYCQIKLSMDILDSNGKKIHTNIKQADAYDIGSIFYEKNIKPNFTYTNMCSKIPEHLKGVVKNAFNVEVK